LPIKVNPQTISFLAGDSDLRVGGICCLRLIFDGPINPLDRVNIVYSKPSILDWIGLIVIIAWLVTTIIALVKK
jgi:hypothetical protein